MKNLIGTWELKTSILTDADHNKFSEDPVSKGKGMLIYTNTGHVSVQIEVPVMTNSSLRLETQYMAYYGVYTFDPKGLTLTHHVICSNHIEMKNKLFERRITFYDNDLISLKNITPEKIAIGSPIYRELFWTRSHANINKEFTQTKDTI